MPDTIHDVGKLCLLYEYGGHTIESCVGLCEGEDPYNATDMAVYAEAWAPFVADVLASSFLIPGWRSKDPTGVRAAEGTFTGPFVGTHGTDSGTPPWESLRACITGRTAFPSAEDHASQTRVFIPLINTIAFAAGTKNLTAYDEAAWQDLRAFLAGNGSIWSDFSGRKAMVRSTVTINFNSYLQDAWGS